MRKDFRIRNYHNLNVAIKSYNQVGNLTHYYRLFSADDDSIDSVIPNIQNRDGKPAVANEVTTLLSSPYKDILYSSHISEDPTSYYRVPFGDATFKPFRNRKTAKTVALWFSLPKLWETIGDPTSDVQIIFNKIAAGESSWIDEGEISISYIKSTNSIRLSINGTNQDPAQAVYPAGIREQHFDLNIESKNLNDFDNPIRPGDWIHFAFTQKNLDDYSSSGINQIADIFSIYINGQDAMLGSSFCNGGDGGSYGSNDGYISEFWRPFMNKGDMLIGRGLPDIDSGAGALPGLLSVIDLAVWNTDLPIEAVESIYSTSQYFEGTGFLSLGPRVQLREEIEIGDAYLTTTGIPKQKISNPFPAIPYASQNPFNDADTVIFHDNELKELQYPTGLPVQSLSTNTRVSCSLATPNSLPTIQAPGFTNSELLGKYYTTDQIKKTIENSPFNDAIVAPNQDTSFYGPTTSISGFSRKVRDKIQLVVELPVNEVSNVTRHSSHWDSFATTNNYIYPDDTLTTNNINPHYDPDGEFHGLDLTGFLYYNFEKGIWEQKGLNDVVTGEMLPAEAVAQQTKAQNLFIINGPPKHYIDGNPKLNSGSFNFLRMFYPGGSYYGHSQYPGGGYGQMEDADGNPVQTELSITDKQLSANVGSPICSHGAPNGIQYFATSSQTIKMSEYIEAPFLLEKVVLEIEDTVARKIYDYSSYGSSPTAGRPQDDYVFFLMRQERTFPGFDPQEPVSNMGEELISIEASSSLRYLICSGVASFYNNERRIPGKLDSSTPARWQTYNSPAFQYDFNHEIDGSDIDPMIRTGSIVLEMEPAVASKKIYGNMFIPTWDGSHALYITQSSPLFNLYQSQSCTVPGFWPGGTTTLPLNGIFSGSRSDVYSVPFSLAQTGSTDEAWWGRSTDKSQYNIRTFFQLNPYRFPMESDFFGREIDPRTYKPFGGGGSATPLAGYSDITTPLAEKFDQWNMGFADNLSKLNAKSPYLLFPDDELVLGLDAALGWTATMAAGITDDARTNDGEDGWNHKRVVGANNLTGSLLRLEAGQVMKLRLYGSMIKDQVQAPKYPEIDTMQNNITDPIIGSHVLDQYDITGLQANSGSYRERLITGSMVNGSGPGRVENPGSETRGSALNKGAFRYKTIYGHTSTKSNHTGWPNFLGAGAIQSTVITCSISSRLTKLKYPDGWASNPYNPAAPGPDMNHIYIRFLSGSSDYVRGHGPEYNLDRIMWGNPPDPSGNPPTSGDDSTGGNPDGKIYPAPDEIWCRTGQSFDFWGNDSNIIMNSLLRAFNGESNYGADPSQPWATSSPYDNPPGSYYVIFGESFNPSVGIPGISAEFTSNAPYTSLGLKAEGGTFGNGAFFLQSSCSHEPGYLIPGDSWAYDIDESWLYDPDNTNDPNEPVILYRSSGWYKNVDAINRPSDTMLPFTLSTGDFIAIRGTGTTLDDAPGFWIKKDEATEIQLYLDKELNNPTLGSDYGYNNTTGGRVYYVSPNDNYNRPGSNLWMNPPGGGQPLPAGSVLDDVREPWFDPGTTTYYDNVDPATINGPNGITGMDCFELFVNGDPTSGDLYEGTVAATHSYIEFPGASSGIDDFEIPTANGYRKAVIGDKIVVYWIDVGGGDNCCGSLHAVDDGSGGVTWQDSNGTQTAGISSYTIWARGYDSANPNTSTFPYSNESLYIFLWDSLESAASGQDIIWNLGTGDTPYMDFGTSNNDHTANPFLMHGSVNSTGTGWNLWQFSRPYVGGTQLGIIPNATSSLVGGLLQANPVRAVAATATRGNLGEFGSFNRFVTIPCNEEVYWDSAPPRIDQVWACMGLSPFRTEIAGISSGLVPGNENDEGDLDLLICGISAGSAVLGVFGASGEPNTGIGELSNPFSSDWWGAYPFEPRFAKVPGTDDPMLRRFGVKAVSTPEGGIAAAFNWITNDVYKGWGQPWTQTKSGSLGMDLNYLFGYAPIISNPPSAGGYLGSAQLGISFTMESQTYGQVPHIGEIAKTSLKTFFGVGEGFGNLIESHNEQIHYPINDDETTGYPANPEGAPNIDGWYPPIYRLFRRMKKPRGWKYGLINALPQNTQAVFRSDHYGQFRDMLESRKFSVFTIMGNSSRADAANTIELNEQPVKITFRTPVWVPDGVSSGNPGIIEEMDPANTRSGNLSTYATSSLPFFDQCWGSDASYPFGRDRPDKIPMEPYDVVLADDDTVYE